MERQVKSHTAMFQQIHPIFIWRILLLEDQGKTLNGNLSATSAANINSTDVMKDGIQNTDSGSNFSIAVNPLENLITELTNGDKCIYMSAATTFPNVTSVATFVNTFMNAINCSKLLTTLFNITNARPEQYSQFKYRFIADVFRSRFVDAKEIAATAVRPIAKYFDVLPLPAMMRVYSNFFADFFFAEEILTPHNAKSLAQKYINSMEETAKRYKINKFDYDYYRKFQAIGVGTRNFFFSVIEPSLSETWELALYYAHEWLLAALDYGDLQDLTFKKEDICEKSEC
ncbi:hypothetical protein HNY73_014256 [Argiope bruennichi]|uniref:Uncharacterized protein n=1 Tax=Argiope bruennichi TaxID=94029 RepID=A0A8T0EPI8_ARGBR|nr:hypothetical protein HNY73_014256 [Argiope bruennichi]